MIFKREPALILAAIHAIIALVIGFGVHITMVQFGLIEAAVAALFAVVVRQAVTPNVSVPPTPVAPIVENPPPFGD